MWNFGSAPEEMGSSHTKSRAQLVRKATYYSVVANCALMFLKCFFGAVAGSYALVADGFHSLSDLTTDFLVLFGVGWWSKPADEEHNYGHAHLEAIVSLGMGLILLVVSFALVYEALEALRSPGLEHLPGLSAFLVFLVSLVVKECLFRYTLAVAIGTGSSALVANAWHHRGDSLSSAVGLVAVSSAWFWPDLSHVDFVGGIIIACFIFYAASKVLGSSLKDLAQVAASRQSVEELCRIVLATDGVRGMHALRTRKVGGRIFADLHILVDPEISVARGHDIVADAERRVLEQLPQVVDFVAHMEPDD